MLNLDIGFQDTILPDPSPPMSARNLDQSPSQKDKNQIASSKHVGSLGSAAAGEALESDGSKNRKVVQSNVKNFG